MESTIPFAVSVVIPVFNAEAFVARAVQSALIQPEVAEVVLVEDGSLDGSLDACSQLVGRYPDRVRLFRHPNGINLGAGPSFNFGIRQAQSPFIAFLGADDYFLPGRFTRDAELLSADPRLDGVYNALGTDFLNEEGKTWWTQGKPPPSLTTLLDPPSPELLFFEMNPIGKRGYFSFDALTVRRTIFDKAAWFSDLRLSQDTLLRIQFAAVCRLAGGQTATPVAMRGVHADNRIKDAAGLLIAKKKVYLELLAWSTQRPLPRIRRRAIQKLVLAICRDAQTLNAAVGMDPSIRFTPWFPIAVLRVWMYRLGSLRWVVCRRTHDDIILPGVFPGLRRKLRNRSTES